MIAGTCILVFGISGVGKTTVCSDFAARHPEYLHYRASALLSAAKSESTERLRTSSAADIRSNQALLGEKLDSLRNGQLQRPVIVECHAIIDNDIELVEVPVSIVQALRPDGLILLEANAETVCARRVSDDRGRPMRTAEEIDRELIMERKAVSAFAVALDLPLVSLDTVTHTLIDDAVSQLAALVRRD